MPKRNWGPEIEDLLKEFERLEDPVRRAQDFLSNPQTRKQYMTDIGDYVSMDPKRRARVQARALAPYLSTPERQEAFLARMMNQMDTGAERVENIRNFINNMGKNPISIGAGLGAGLAGLGAINQERTKRKKSNLSTPDYVDYKMSKRFYKADNKENDPRKRGKNIVENIKSKVKSTIVDPTVRGYNRVKDAATREVNAIRKQPEFLREQYERGRTGKKVDQQNPIARTAGKIGGTVGFIEGIDEGLGKAPSRFLTRLWNNRGKNPLRLITGEDKKMVEKRSASMGKRATAPKMAKNSSTPEYINYIYGSRPTSPQPITNYPRPTPSAKPPQPTTSPKPIPVFNQKMGKRATAPKMTRKTTATSSRQAGMINGRPVSLKKRANTSMKYFK